MKLLDLGFQLAYYKAYHLEKHNVKIHLFCIPLILLTAVIMVGQTPLLWPLTAAYGLYYLLLDVKVGSVAAALVTGMAFVALGLKDCSSQVWYGVIATHVIAWAAQFYGHFHYEHKSPAVFDNLVQPLVLAPYFVLFEIVFMFGYRRDLEKTMLRQAKAKRNAMK